jgi:hypothetical protein
VLRHCKPLDWAPRLSDWGELASALYEYRGWGRDIFRLDYGYVEGGQHDAALESLAATHTLEYLYAEFDDGKSVLIKTPHDMWQEVKMTVDLDSRRWFPQSAESFGKEVNRLKQALAYKGFGVDRGHSGTGNNKKRAMKTTRLDGSGTVWDSSGTVENGKTVPAENCIDKPESARPEDPGTVGTVLPTSFSGNKEKIGDVIEKEDAKNFPNCPSPRKTGRIWLR